MLEFLGSEKSCLNFYIGVAGTTGQGSNPATEVLTVKDQSDFLEGDFEDLVILNKSGLMSPFGSSLYLAQRARKKLEEKILEKIEGSEMEIRVGSGLGGTNTNTNTNTNNGTGKKQEGKAKS